MPGGQDKKIIENKEKIQEALAQQKEDDKKKLEQEQLSEDIANHRRKYAEAMAELRNKHIKKNARGETTTLSEELSKECDRIIEQDIASANLTWQSHMQSLLKLMVQLNERVAVSAEQAIGEAGYEFGQLLEKGPSEDGLLSYVPKLNQWKGLGTSSPITEGGLLPLKNWFVNKIKDLADDPDLDLPGLQHKVSFKDGKVEIDKLTRADGIAFDETSKESKARSNQINNSFKALVDVWLAGHGYEPDPKKPGAYVSTTPGNPPLDEAAFKKLQDDPDTSLKNFLKKSVDLDLEERPPTPGMR